MRTYPLPREPREPLRAKVDRVIFDRDLMHAIMGIEIGIGAILFYVGLIILMVVGALGAGLEFVALGVAIAFIGSLPVFKPEWLSRWGFPDPLA